MRSDIIWGFTPHPKIIGFIGDKSRTINIPLSSDTSFERSEIEKANDDPLKYFCNVPFKNGGLNLYGFSRII